MGQTKQPKPAFKLRPALIVGQMGAFNETSPKQEHISGVKKRFLPNKYATPKLPKGLIGAKYTAQVEIKGQQYDCLLDTGSQVTTVSQSCYENNFSDLEIHPINELLEIEAANGQNVPYSGFIGVDITFPKECFGSEITVSSFALVVPDTCSNIQSSFLIGTNTLDITVLISKPYPMATGWFLVCYSKDKNKKQTAN